MFSPRDLPHLTDGRLPFTAWPGLEPILYYARTTTPPGEEFLIACPSCATDCVTGRDWEGYEVWYWETHDEGPDVYCDFCDVPIPSAYGDPDSDLD